MEANQLLDLVKRYEENRDFISNEETAKMALVVPFIKHLGFDPNSPREVRLEYCADFIQQDGKKFPDRMDFAIFDKTGEKPQIVIETKPLGTDLRSRSQQLARYLAQLPDLHFGIITDGCHYLFFGDLERPNVMDAAPFFEFSLDNPRIDWGEVAKFLTKFSREVFDPAILITEAENSRYRQEMIDKLEKALMDPGADEGFVLWIADGVYKGKKTGKVMERLNKIAKEAIKPALLQVMSADYLENLKESIQQRMREAEKSKAPAEAAAGEPQTDAGELATEADSVESAGSRQMTTDEELEFFNVIAGICSKAGIDKNDILYKDTVNYFNVSYLRPTKWFIRFFSRGDRKSIVTLLPIEEANRLAQGFTVTEAPAVFGTSRIQIENVAQMWALQELVVKSLEVTKAAAPVATAAQ